MPSPPYPIAGIIRDNEKNILVGATVYVVDTTTGEKIGSGFFSTTNVNGEYVLNLQHLSTYTDGDTYEVVANLVGYDEGKVTGTVDQSGGGDNDKDIDLDPVLIGPSVRDILGSVSKNEYIDQGDGETKAMLEVSRAGTKKSNAITIYSNIVFNDLAVRYSDVVYTKRYTDFVALIDILKTSSPTNVIFTPQISDDNVTWYEYTDDSNFAKTENATITHAILGTCPGKYYRLSGVATGTDGSKTFTVTIKLILYN